MRAKTLGRRLDGLRNAARIARGGGLLIIHPEAWPEEARSAYEAARDAGDHERQADILHAQTGRRPVSPRKGDGLAHDHAPLQLIIIRSRPDGPQ